MVNIVFFFFLLEGNRLKAYSIGPILVLPIDTSRKPCGDQTGYQLGALGREVEWGVPTGVFADAVGFMTGVDKEFLEAGQLLQVCLGVVRLICGGEMGPGNSHTAISRRPSLAARCSEVLPLSLKSGFCKFGGLFLIMRLTSRRSLRWMARRRRMETSILNRP